GLHYTNVQAIAAIPDIAELNIGHAIVAHAVFAGWQNAVREMKAIMVSARLGRGMHDQGNPPSPQPSPARGEGAVHGGSGVTAQTPMTVPSPLAGEGQGEGAPAKGNPS